MFDGIYLACAEAGELAYAGKLERGFSDDDKKQMIERLKSLRIRRQPMTASRKKFPKAQCQAQGSG
jgi:ATP-dependent DNA ligase